MTDTPRTEKERFRVHDLIAKIEISNRDEKELAWKFARQLERELAAATPKLNKPRSTYRGRLAYERRKLLEEEEKSSQLQNFLKESIRLLRVGNPHLAPNNEVDDFLRMIEEWDTLENGPLSDTILKNNE